MSVFEHTILTDIKIIWTESSPEPDSQTWRRTKKDLCLYKSPRSAWLYTALVQESELTADITFIVDIKISDRCPGNDWEGRDGGIWILRRSWIGRTDQGVTAINVLFGRDAVDPRPGWVLMESPLQLDISAEIPIARLTVLYGRADPNPEVSLRVTEDGNFKIVQISDTHMGVDVGLCNDAMDDVGTSLSALKADPLTVDFMGKILDLEKPDLVVLTGDQIHHDVEDSETALFKAVAPIIKRQTPFAAVFGNHDSEGTHALERDAQMSILQSLPFSLCEAGLPDIAGVGNYCLHIYGPSSYLPEHEVLTLYLLDSHIKIESGVKNPDYRPIQKSQIDWFRKVSEANQRERERYIEDGSFHLSLVFQHIPLPEFEDAQIQTGDRREPTEGPSSNTHFYRALVERDVIALGVGHDHVNDFSARRAQEVQQIGGSTASSGPWFCHAGCAGFRGYGSYNGISFYRRARVWDYSASQGSLKTWLRVEHSEDRKGELKLATGGKVVDPNLG